MAVKCSGENLPLPKHKHIEILDQDGLGKVDNTLYVILTFKVTECKVAECKIHFKRITSIPTTKIDCKSIVSNLMKNPFIYESMSKIRSKSTDTNIKKEIALNLLEDLLEIKITTNLTEDDGFRKLTSN